VLTPIQWVINAMPPRQSAGVNAITDPSLRQDVVWPFAETSRGTSRRSHHHAETEKEATGPSVLVKMEPDVQGAADWID